MQNISKNEYIDHACKLKFLYCKEKHRIFKIIEHEYSFILMHIHNQNIWTLKRYCPDFQLYYECFLQKKVLAAMQGPS